jgi:hypothetical protein
MTVNDQPTTFRPQTHVLAIISLVLSLLGLVPVLPVVGGIGGIITGVIARREIRENPTQYTGDGLARAGIIIGWVCVGLAVLICLGFVAFFTLTMITTNTISTGSQFMPTGMPSIQLQP